MTPTTGTTMTTATTMTTITPNNTINGDAYLAVPSLDELQKILDTDGPVMITIQNREEDVYVNLVRMFHARW